MNATRLFAIGCDHVLYAPECLSDKKLMEAFHSVIRDYQLPDSILNWGNFYIRQQKFDHLYNFIFKTATKYHLSYQEITEHLSARTDYSAIRPNPALLEALHTLGEKNEICIYTNQTEHHVNAVFQRLFGQDVAHCKGIALCHIGTLQSGNNLCAKYTPKSLWLLSKTFGVSFEDIYFLDDFNPTSAIKPSVGKMYQTTHYQLPALLKIFANDSASQQANLIQRHTPSPFDRQLFLSAKISERLLNTRA